MWRAEGTTARITLLAGTGKQPHASDTRRFLAGVLCSRGRGQLIAELGVKVVFFFRKQQQKNALFVSILLQRLKNIVASKFVRIIPREFFFLFYIVLKFALHSSRNSGFVLIFN